ncbi:hypothetical protein HZA26_03120 [Candidatus Nomurabacteria bacterium]|nr:hypothetical protein [Candidatus Nomurabacteria bacterium]
MHVLQILLLEEIEFINHWAVVFAENFYVYKLLRYHLEFLTKKALCSDRCKKTAEELMDYLGVFADPMIRSAHFDGFTKFKAVLSLLGIDITQDELANSYGAFDWEKGAEEWRQKKSQELSSAVATEQAVRTLAAPAACIATIPNADIWNQHEVLGWDTLELIATLPPVAIEMLVVERRFQRRHFVHQVFSRPNTVLLLDLVVGKIAKKIPGIRSVYNNTLGAWIEKLLTNHRARADHFYPLITLIREKSESLELLKTLHSMSIADPEILVTAARLLEFSFTWNTLLFAAEKLKKEAEVRKAAGEAPQEFDREISELVKRMNDASTVAEKLGKLSLLYQQSLMHTVSDLMLIVGSTWGAVHYSSPLLQHLTQLLK